MSYFLLRNTWTLRESVVVVRTADMRSDFGSRSPGSAGSPMAVKFSDYFEAPAAREGTGLCPRGGAGLGPVATLALPLPGREGPEGPASSGGRERVRPGTGGGRPQRGLRSRGCPRLRGRRPASSPGFAGAGEGGRRGPARRGARPVGPGAGRPSP